MKQTGWLSEFSSLSEYTQHYPKIPNIRMVSLISELKHTLWLLLRATENEPFHVKRFILSAHKILCFIDLYKIISVVC